MAVIDPQYQQALFHLGVVDLNVGDLQAAQRELSKATELNPNDGRAFS